MHKIILVILLFSFNLFAHTHRGAISHAPIGVMGDHTHKKGEVMMGVRYMTMSKKDMGSGTDDLSDSQYSQTMKPREMEMTMVMMGVMYGLTDRLTIVPGIKYITKDMTMYNSMSGMNMENDASGLGDIKLTALYDLSPHDKDKVIVAKFSLSVPTGDTEVTNAANSRLPYGIQLGSGTYDPTFGITYKKYIGSYELGGQLQYTTRIGENDEGYTLGDILNSSFWTAYRINSTHSTSLRIQAKYQDRIDGADKNLTIMPSMNTAADPDNYGGTVVNLFWGWNTMWDGTKGTDHRLAFEIGMPVSQNLHGKQLKLDQVMTLGWQKMF
jgi:hypothetical protein